MPKKLSSDTSAIIRAIESAALAAKHTSDLVSQELVTHTRHDDERFEQLTTLVESIAQDVKSLLASRSYTRGMVKMASIFGGIAGALITAVLAYLKGH